MSFLLTVNISAASAVTFSETDLLLLVVGTRPEIIKMASVIDSLRTLSLDFELVHTMQHYDWEMSGQFMQELGYQKPDYTLNVGSGTQAKQTAAGMIGVERLALRSAPSAIVVQGDTNTVLAAAIAGVKLRIPVCHVEAGLRSYDFRMPEEHNRRIVDHVSSLLFSPTTHAARTLRGEKVWGRILVTGNTVIDACLRFLNRAVSSSTILNHEEPSDFAFATFHRAENVDHPNSLRTIVKVLASCPVRVVFPVHPRTMSRLRQYGLLRRLMNSRNVRLLRPLDYFDTLTLMKHSSFVLTDSGGIQEEITSPNIRKYAFVLRKTTDRPESVRAGFAKVVGVDDAEAIIRHVKSFVKNGESLPNRSPYGNGQAGLNVAEGLKLYS